MAGIPWRSVKRTGVWLTGRAELGKDVLGVASKAGAVVIIVVRVIAGLRRSLKIFVFEAGDGTIRIWVSTYGSPTDGLVVGEGWVGR